MADTSAGNSIPEPPTLEKQLATALRALSALARGQIGAAEDALDLLEARSRQVPSAATPRPQVGATLLRLVIWR